jgi:LysM repeat protein
MKYFRSFLFFGLFLLTSLYSVAQTPDSFTTHKVKRGETIELLIDQYEITKTQLLEYNPSLEKFGLRKRMNLRIPVYQVKEPIAVTENNNLTAEDSFEFTLHEVIPKETKWRLAYQYKTTIQTLDSLNPEIKEGLKIGQKIRIPLTPSLQVLPEKDSLYNYYTVLPKEVYYLI